jgi:hypothetical protein
LRKSINLLNEKQINRAKEILDEYLNAKPDSDGLTSIEKDKIWDQDRLKVIKDELQPLINDYLNGTIALFDFKLKIDSISKRLPLWGFKGIKGQMFLTCW